MNYTNKPEEEQCRNHVIEYGNKITLLLPKDGLSKNKKLTKHLLEIKKTVENILRDNYGFNQLNKNK